MISQSQLTAVETLQKQRNKLFMLTQFQKRNCHPLLNADNLLTKCNSNLPHAVKSFDQEMGDLAADPTNYKIRKLKTGVNRTQVISEEELHPRYSEKENGAFIREMYRLKGFAYLRNQ